MRNSEIAALLLRLGLAAVFLYAAIAALINPSAWLGFFPQFLRAVIPAQALLVLHSAGEIFLALWLLSGWRAFYAGLLTSAALFTIVITNIALLDVVFRDIAIFFSALALAFLSRRGGQ